MTKKERVKAALAHRETDCVPYQMDCLSAAEKKLKAHYGDVDLDQIIGNHIAMFEPSFYSLFQTETLDSGRFKDAFGAIWELKPGEDIGTVIKNPLKEATLKDYTFPDPDKVMELANIPAFIDNNKDKFIMGALGFLLYERAWILRGIEPILYDFLANPSFVEELFDRICEFNLVITKRLCQFPIDAFHFGDDWGQQHGLIIDPELWRKFFKKRLKKLYDAVHDAGLPVSIHSCGDITAIIPDLIEIGVNMISPLQAEALDFKYLKKEYGKDLTFWGGVSTQRTLPKGTPQDIRAEIRERIRVLAKDGGYILAPSHELQGDIPLENMLAFIEAVQDQEALLTGPDPQRL
jgi:uroporphyrinogen decarboxylase